DLARIKWQLGVESARLLAVPLKQTGVEQYATAVDVEQVTRTGDLTGRSPESDLVGAHGSRLLAIRTGNLTASASRYSSSVLKFDEIGDVAVGEVHASRPSRLASSRRRARWNGSLTRI